MEGLFLDVDRISMSAWCLLYELSHFVVNIVRQKRFKSNLPEFSSYCPL
jgi:hypothetical protein